MGKIVLIVVLLCLLVSSMPAMAQIDPLEPIKPLPTPIDIQPVPIELRPTNPIVLEQLDKQNIDVQYVKLTKDYTALTPYSQTYTDIKTDTSIAVFSQLPQVNAQGQVIEVGFIQTGNSYTSKPNTFTLVVTGNQASLSAYGEGTVWNPTLSIGGVEYTSNPPVLLAVDPYNSYYSNNVIEWDYGICKRHLRIIEGMMREWWVFPANPNNDVWIHHHRQGDISLNLGHAWDSAGSSLKALTLFGSVETVAGSEFIDSLVYPVMIGGSATFYPEGANTVDGDCMEWVIGGDTWHNVQGGTGSNHDDTNTAMFIQILATGDANKWGRVKRSLTVFNTASLPDGAIIQSATLSLHGDAAGYTDTLLGAAPTFNICSHASAADDALANGDFNSLGVVAFSTSITFAAWGTGGYNDYVLNAAGLAAISLIGVSKFGIREWTYDAPDISPTWGDSDSLYLAINTAEKGAGFKPMLVIVYAAEPEVLTQAATLVTHNSATLNGNITDDTGGNATIRGFDWDINSGAPYANEELEIGNWGNCSFTAAINTLDPGTTYYFRAKAQNPNGWGYGTELFFTTAIAAPAITTKAATNIAMTSARLNAYVDDDGGEACEARFNYYKQGGGWGNFTSAWIPGFTTGDTPFADATSLDAASTYFFRGEIRNGNSTVLGAALSFSTLSSVGNPSGLVAIPKTDDAIIDLEWTKGYGATVDIIRYKIGGYPTDETDGEYLASIAGGSYAHEGLIPGTTYYYRIWGFSGGNYSTGYTEAMAATTAVGASATVVVDDVPSSWFFDVDHTRVAAFPLYSMFGLGFTDFSLPFNTAWFVTVMFFVTIAALAVYGLGQRTMVQTTGQYQMESGSYSLVLAIVAAVVIMGIMGGLRIVPGMYAILYCIAAIGFGVVLRRL